MKTLTVMLIGLLAGLPVAGFAYDPLAGVRGDVSKIMDPNTSSQELDAISQRHKRWHQQNQANVQQQEMWRQSQQWEYEQRQRRAREQTEFDASRVQTEAEGLANQTQWVIKNGQ
jgi:hypothetical protein